MQKDVFAFDQYLPGNDLELVSSGEPFFAQLRRVIDNAQEEIYIQMYIFEEDNTGKEVIETIKRARERQVKIFLAVDSYGSKSLSDEFVADMKRIGVHFKFFSPLHFFRMGRRLHNKVVVADGTEALVGGINIADKYRGTADELPWLDFAVRVKGPVCADLARVCKRIHGRKYFGKSPDYPKKTVHFGKVHTRLALNDWLRQKNQISAGYKSAFRKAEVSITIVASYFLPGRSLRTALKYAARRGVKVAVMLPGELDIPMAKRATRYLYRWLLREKVDIYEWGDSILHGKMAVVDSKWATVGSYNLNHLSEYSSIEMNVEALDENFASAAQQTLAGLLEKCSRVPADSFSNRGLINKFLDWISYILGRWFMLFLFFLVMRESRYKAHSN